MLNLIFCDSCGQGISLALVEVTLHRALGYACDECAGEYNMERFRCQYCLQDLPTEDCHPAYPACDVCRDCGDHTRECESCGDEFHEDGMTVISGDYYCADCRDYYSECDNCGLAFRSDNGYSGGQSVYCSDHCYGQNWTYCCDCDTEVPIGEHCDCRDRCEDNNGISPYNYKPQWEKIGDGPRYMGIEMEVSCKGSIASYHVSSVGDILGDYLACVKEDGSVTNGFEIVTNPISAEVWASVPLEDLHSFLVREKYRSHETDCCGLHVHISRTGLTDCTLAKMAIFVYVQREKLEKLGRRCYGPYCGYKDATSGKSVKYLLHENDRYGAINFCNRSTVEYRFPRGTLNPSTIRATVGLCHAITEFCQRVSIAGFYRTKETWVSFVKFLASEKQYKHVLAYAKERGTV